MEGATRSVALISWRLEWRAQRLVASSAVGSRHFALRRWWAYFGSGILIAMVAIIMAVARARPMRSRRRSCLRLTWNGLKPLLSAIVLARHFAAAPLPPNYATLHLSLRQPSHCLHDRVPMDRVHDRFADGLDAAFRSA